MGYEIRPLTADDIDQAWRLDMQVFNAEDRYRDGFEGLSEPDRFQGAFDDRGRLVAQARAIPFGQYFGGRRVTMGGLSSVGVLPEARGRGLGEAVCGAALGDMRERGEVVSSLIPATTALYRKLGWELAGAYVIRRIDCAALRSLRVSPDRRIERAEHRDLPRIQACYEKFAPTVTGFLDRAQPSWYFLDKRFDDFFVYLSLDAAGEVDGYVMYKQGPPLPDVLGYTIRVRDWAALSGDALASLFWTVGSSSSQAGAVLYPSSPECPLLFRMQDQVERVYWDVRFMTRIVDVEGAIAQRGFSTALDIDVPLRLEERGSEAGAASLAANAGDYRLQVSKGEGRLEHVSPSSADVPRIDIGGFASLYSGWSQTLPLARTGLLEGGTSDQRAALDLAFAGPTPWLPEEF
jgi:predicted acetyltransferase